MAQRGKPRKVQTPAQEPDIEQAKKIAKDIWHELLEEDDAVDVNGAHYARKVGYAEAQMKHLLAALGERVG